MISADALFEKLKHVKIGAQDCLFTREKCEAITPLINDINQLKAEKNAVILAHSYVSPEIIYGVADYVGDSYQLSKNAKETQADTIVFSAVKFMAETAKLLNPNKDVLIPSTFNGCSLADSITGEQAQTLRKEHPDYTFVCYINTTADVKAACDVCVTSSNVYDIIEAIPNRHIYFLPDKLMGENVQAELKRRGVDKDIKLWDGRCYVHEAYDPEMIQYLRLEHDNLVVLAHPECNNSVIEEADFVGSTSQMMSHVNDSKATSFFLLTECGLTSRLQAEMPHKSFIGSCTLCKYMKSNTLQQIKRVLTQPTPNDYITLDSHTQEKALACIDQMFHYSTANKRS